MGAITNSVHGALGALAAGSALAQHMKNKKIEMNKPAATTSDTGVDAAMAAKARKVAQQKINAIYSNKELSNKARTRRIGKAIDEFSSTIGGNK